MSRDAALAKFKQAARAEEKARRDCDAADLALQQAADALRIAENDAVAARRELYELLEQEDSTP